VADAGRLIEQAAANCVKLWCSGGRPACG
jgi:hypothetical protein